MNNIFKKLLLIITLITGWCGSVWAQTSQLPLSSGVYEILNISDEGGSGTGRGYLVNYTNHSSGLGLADCTWSAYRNKHPLERNSSNTSSYWYVHNHGDGTYTIVSISTLNDNTKPRFVQVGNPSRLTETEVYLEITDNTNASRDGRYAVKIANHSASNNYLSGACGTNSDAGAGAVRQDGNPEDGGAKWSFNSIDDSQLTEAQKSIRAKYLERFIHLPNGVNLAFQDINGVAIPNTFTSKLVKYTPESGSPIEFIAASATHDFNNALFTRSRFTGTFDYKLIDIIYTEATNTLTFTVELNKWYTLKLGNVNAYLSSDYADAAGLKLANPQAEPTTYGGYWRMVETGSFARNDGVNVNLYNAKYYDDKVFAIGGDLSGNGNAARAGMYSWNDIPANYYTELEKRDRTSTSVFRIDASGSNNYYISRNNGTSHIAVWNSGSAYTDNNSQYTIEKVPTMGESVTLVVNAPDGVNIKFNTDCEAASFLGLTNVQDQTLYGGNTFNFHNMPFLSSLFTAENIAVNKRLLVQFDEATQTLTLSIIDQPGIIHRTPWTVDKVNSATDVPPANTGFMQKDLADKGMIKNPNTLTLIQNAPVFEITEYIKPGTSKDIYLPTVNTNGNNTSLKEYQRWYDYETEGLVNTAVYDFSTRHPNGKLYYNGYVTGKIYNALTNIDTKINVTLPSGMDKYDLALDHSRYFDYRKDYDGQGNLLEPTISQRVIYHLVDANVMAQKLEDLASDEWFEERVIHFPSKKMGSKDARNGFDIIGLKQTYGNYWYYANAEAKAAKNPTKVSNDNDFTFEITCSDPTVDVNSLGVGVLAKNNKTMPSASTLHLPNYFNGKRFIMFNYPSSGKFADKSELVIKILVHGKRVAKFTLVFDDGSEPLPILDVAGKNSDGTHKSMRSTSAMIEQFGQPIAKVTFDAPQIPFVFPNSLASYNLSDNTYNWQAAKNEKYGLPVANQYTDYSFFAGGGSGDNQYMGMGEYRIDSECTGTSGKFKIRPVDSYLSALGDPSVLATSGYKSYFAMADVSEQPGKIISLPFSTPLCPGQRIYMQGWIASATDPKNNQQQQSSVILNVYGYKNGNRTLIYSYCPGLISSAYEKEGTLYESINDSFSSYQTANNGYVIWNQVNCSFLLSNGIVYDSYQLEVDNNSYSSTGCDVVIDNFCVFVNPPKGNVDFTTPLCSDKTRHAKIHADYDMLWEVNGINDQVQGASLTASYCFLEASVFDNYSENGMTIKDMFDLDDKGNHNLKPEYNASEESVKNIINKALRAALVGKRVTKASGDEDHGFHSYYISTDFESIPLYSYNDSKCDVIYRETVDGIRRIVFKEDVVRGEMAKVQDTDGHWYYPHMRPSTEYYLVFAPHTVDQESIDNVHVGTDVFHIHESCSFFGKFTTKDPMHVILDNAEIAADLPVQAVCHGETMELSFDMPALKEEKKINGVIPIFDEANCTSIESKNDQYVSGTEGPKYKYEPVLTTELVQTRIKNLPYDWWFGGDYEGTKIGGTFEAYMAAKHPSIKYSHPEHNHTHAEGYKKDGEYVDIPLAMKDLRFYYPDFGKDKETLTSDDWNTIYTHDYDNDAGYSLLQSEINAIRDLVDRGILVLHRTNYDLSLSTETAEDEGGQKVVNFTLVPIMPSQQNYVDEPYIYCPEPRGVKVKLRDAAPKMLNGFGDKTYPTDMQNVPVRAGLQQLNAVSHDLASVISADAKKLRVPLRGLSKALDEGKYLMPYEKTTGNVAINTVFLVDTNDPVYENKFDNQEQLTAWGKITQMQADFTKKNNFMDLVFNKDYKMREGYTYRIGVRFVEVTDEAKTTRDIACDGIFYFDLKVVPEFQVWTGKESVKNPTNITEWTNDRNWARADRTDLLADGTKTGNVITAATDYAVVDNYPNNDDNFGNHTWGADSLGFMPMYFTNVLFNEVDVEAPILSAASIDSSTGFLSTAGTQSNRSGFEHHVMIDHEITDKQIAFIKNDAAAKDQKVFSIVYDMSVAPTGSDNNVMALTNRYAAPFNGSSYMCEPFGTNVTKGITFAPQTQLINAQHLTYYKAWVEYELDVNRWYTLGSPLQNTFAGEWYAPTDGGQQNSPYFYDITYQQGAGSQQLNDRFRPAIYQRSWDSKGNVPVYLKAGGGDAGTSSFGGNTEPAYVKADWSNVFNDVQKQYSNGGFSVKVNTDLMTNKPSDDKAIIRLPKADTKYTYYDSDGTTGQHNNIDIAVKEYRGRLWSDKLVNATSFTQTISNSTDNNNFFLVNNPFMANMDMSAFFAANTQLGAKYWIMSGDKQLVAVQNYDGSWVSTTGDNAKVGPLQGFFVKGTGKETTVTFTAAMQANTGASTAIQTRASMTESLNQLAIHASRNGYTSTAVVALSAQASNDFKADEDAQTFVDGNVLSEPTLYTVASDQAMTINTLSNIEVLPLGIVSDDDSEVILTFNLDSYEGHDLQLFDAVTRQLIDLSSDTELAVSGNNSNRYYIARAGALNQFGDRMQNADGEIYNLQGLQLGTAGKGTIVIINGEKHIVK